MSCSDIQKFKKFQKDKSKVKNQIKYTKGLLLPCGSDSKASAYNAGDPGSIPGLGRSPGEGNGKQPTPVLLPRKFHGWRSLVGYSPWAHKETQLSDFTFTFTPWILKRVQLHSRVILSFGSK